MFVFVWAYTVRPGREADFERGYSGSGEWADWFSAADGYLGTNLFRPSQPGGEYITIDKFISKAARDDYVAANQASYEALDAVWESATLSERKLGEFALVD